MPAKLLLKPFWQKIKKITSFIFFTGIFFFALYFFNQFFSIKEIELVGVDKKFLLIGLDLYKNKNLIFLKEKELIKVLKELNPQVKVITINKKFPQKLIIFVELYQPVALIKAKNHYWYLSSEGRILFKSIKDDSFLPIINYYQLLGEESFAVGDWLNYQDIIMALKFIGNLEEMGLKVDRIDITGYDMILFKIGKQEIYFTSKKKEEEQRYMLETIIKQFKIEKKEFKKLDLRFDKPIIVFN